MQTRVGWGEHHHEDPRTLEHLQGWIPQLSGVPELNLRDVAGRRLDGDGDTIDDISYDDTAEYVRHRLHHAGAEKNLFAADAVALIHEHSTGALRDVDRIAANAMRDALRRKKKVVDRDAVERVLEGKTPIA